jgi:hypothetical protein
MSGSMPAKCRRTSPPRWEVALPLGERATFGPQRRSGGDLSVNLAIKLRQSSSSGYCVGRTMESFFTWIETVECAASLTGKVRALDLRTQSLVGTSRMWSVRMAKALPMRLRLVITWRSICRSTVAIVTSARPVLWIPTTSFLCGSVYTQSTSTWGLEAR